MDVHKFGGSLLRTSEDYQKVINYIKKLKNVVCVVSASYNSTNLLTRYCLEKDHYSINQFIKFHKKLCEDLNSKSEKLEWLTENYETIEKKFIERNIFVDQLISYGELISTEIIANACDKFEWRDIRNFLHTDNNYGRANINTEQTKESFKSFRVNQTIITQGFIARSDEGFTSTLGREGSDYSASLIAQFLDAKKVVLHKDVGGLYSVDPKIKKSKNCLEKVSYDEAKNMGLYGPQVIHHKTIQPLKSNGIKTYIRYLNETKGTLISKTATQDDRPIIALKPNQVFISLDLLNNTSLIEFLRFFFDHSITLENLKYDQKSARFTIDNSIGGTTLASGEKDIVKELALEDILKKFGSNIVIKHLNQITFIKDNLTQNFKILDKFIKKLRELDFEILETPDKGCLCVYMDNKNYKLMISEF